MIYVESKTSLTACQFQFTLMCAKLIEYAYANGYTCTFGETYRSDEQAELNALGSDGRTYLVTQLEKFLIFKPFTKALKNNVGSGIAKSAHCNRLAVDLLLFKSGVYLQSTKDYLPLGLFWESLGGTWGGRFKDGNHFSCIYKGVK